MKLNALSKLSLKKDNPMPALFIGHGSPMNGIENNVFSTTWAELGKKLPEPQAVLCISAHWLTQGTLVTAMENPKTIHDFGGFPPELYSVQYPAPGNPDLASQISHITELTHIGKDHDWGLDHGTWTVVRHMYPEANIPILQLSIDYYRKGQWHYELARELADLRKRGVLIIGSGNMVHNLRMAAFDKLDTPGYGYDWAIEMNEVFKKHILSRNHLPLIEYDRLGPAASLAIPTPDHYWPLIYALGLSSPKEEIELFNDELLAGSLTMTSVIFYGK